jgi:hypothetical protein
MRGIWGILRPCKDATSHFTSKNAFFFLAILGFELKAYILNHPTSPIFVKGFLRYGLVKYLPRMASN